MGLNFRKRVKILPGLTMNFGKRGTSFTIGKRGASINVSKRGTYANVGIPGTGISYRERISKPKSNSKTSSYRGTSGAGYAYQNTNPYASRNYDPQQLSEPQASAMMWVILALVYVVAIAFFYASTTNAYSSPFALLVCYTIGSIALAFAAAFTSISINAAKHKEVVNGVSLGALSLMLTPIVFYIWTRFWPSYAHTYRTVWGHKVQELVDLSGWITGGCVFAFLSFALGVILLITSLAKDNTES